MEGVTYCLSLNNKNSDKYYREVESISREIKNLIINEANNYLDDFIEYILKDKVESPRTKEEYAIEFLMIGVMLSEYGKYVNSFNKSFYEVFKLLNKLKTNEGVRKKVDLIRGQLISHILYKRKDKADKPDLKSVVRWMDATGDFEEEVYRLKLWIKFLQHKDKSYYDKLVEEAIKVADDMENICEDILGIYTSQLEKFLNNIDEKYKNREDLIYCSKNRIQYFFNMIAAEIMNEVYRNEFLRCDVKKIFVPSCMKQVVKPCRCVKGQMGYSCRQCNNSCNIYMLNKILEETSIEVCIIPHETTINTLKVNDKSKVGIIGVACIPNLMSGGWKALRLGFIPQCVLLDYSGCENHWLDKGIMTSINLNRLKKVLI